MDQLTHDALTLSELDRAILAQTLLRSLEPITEEGVQEAWDAEIAQRLERVRQGTATGRPAEEERQPQMHSCLDGLVELR